MVDVSIIIVSWNTKDILYGCLKSISEQTKNIDYEIVVVDNASTDGSVEMIKKNFLSVILIENSKNRGFAAANNQGIIISKGHYVLLLNSDTIVLDNAITKTVRFVDAHSEAAVVGCRVLNPDRTLQPTCFMFPSILNMILSSSYLYKLFPRSTFFGRERMAWWDRSDVRAVDVVTGCFMLVRREAIEQVGMMDEQFFMYGEETDWCYRFKQAGWKIMFTPVGEIIHWGGQSTKKLRVDMLVQLRLSILKFISKHHGWLKHKVACFLTALFFALRVPMWFAASILGRKCRKQATVRLRAYVSGIGQALFALAGSPMA
ncbi:MAG: glycosyltransferase family 2 protein [Planctomycetota bacterium]|jgi:GT2 family glycosyltransferase